MKKIILAALICATASFAGFTDAGTMEAGGRFSFSSIDYNFEGDSRGHYIAFQPVFNVYVVDQLYIAAKVHLESTENGGFFGIGGGVGYAFVPDGVVVPYVEGGIEFIHSSYVKSAGLAVPISGGVKIPVFPHVNIDLNMGIYPKFINDNPGADFGIAGGVTIPIF